MEDHEWIDSSSSEFTFSTTSTQTPIPLTTSEVLAHVIARLQTMAVEIPQQVFIDGSFEDLADELAAYIDNVQKTDEANSVRAQIKPLIEANQKDEVLKKIVTASPALNAAPEKEFTAAYNLLVYLVIQSPNVNIFLPKVCENLSKPITSSPINGSGLALSVLTTLFNLLAPENEVRFNVFQAILRLVKSSGLFEMLRPQLKKLDSWVEQWEIDEEAQRKIFGQIADVAEDAGEDE
jgi:translation initiation factor 3 subunit M